MFISNHVLIGALVGRAVSRRRPGMLPAVAAGVASHYVADMVPHWGLGRQVGARDPAFLRAAVPDGLIGLALLLTVARRTPVRPVAFAAAVAACLPDADKPAETFVGRSPFPGWHDRWHARIQRESPRRLPLELAVGVGLLAALLADRPPQPAGR